MAIALLVVFVVAACGGQVTQAAQPLATAAEPVQATALPVTGQASPTAIPAARTDPGPAGFQPTPTNPGCDRSAGPGGCGLDALQCTSPAALSPALTEGPYFKANSPERTSLLEPGMTGTKLMLTGYVLTTDCQPVANALVDFWQADAEGQYDNSGYTLRGHQFTDANGRYQLETVVPGLYPGRTEHIHVKVQAPWRSCADHPVVFP